MVALALPPCRWRCCRRPCRTRKSTRVAVTRRQRSERSCTLAPPVRLTSYGRTVCSHFSRRRNGSTKARHAELRGCHRCLRSQKSGSRHQSQSNKSRRRRRRPPPAAATTRVGTSRSAKRSAALSNRAPPLCPDVSPLHLLARKRRRGRRRRSGSGRAAPAPARAVSRRMRRSGSAGRSGTTKRRSTSTSTSTSTPKIDGREGPVEYGVPMITQC